MAVRLHQDIRRRGTFNDQLFPFGHKAGPVLTQGMVNFFRRFTLLHWIIPDQYPNCLQSVPNGRNREID